MPIVKVRTNRQVTIPKAIFDQTGLAEGDYVEVSRDRDQIVIKLKRLVDADDVLSTEEEEEVARGEEEIERGRTASWDKVREQLGL
jgi:AbrB family looped-hinge helix DNA binding protein